MRIKGKEEQQMIVLISGGSSGIGKAAAERFVMGGHTVYELSRSGADREGIRHLRADVSKRDEVFAAVELLIERKAAWTCFYQTPASAFQALLRNAPRRRFANSST